MATGRNIALSLPRRLVCDLVHSAHRVPTVRLCGFQEAADKAADLQHTRTILQKRRDLHRSTAQEGIRHQVKWREVDVIAASVDQLRKMSAHPRVFLALGNRHLLVIDLQQAAAIEQAEPATPGGFSSST